MAASTCSKCSRALLDCATSGGCERRAALVERWPAPWGDCSCWWGDGKPLRKSEPGTTAKAPPACDVCGGSFRAGKPLSSRGDSVECTAWSNTQGSYTRLAHTRCVGRVFRATQREVG